MSDITTDRLRATLRSLLEEHRTDATSLSRQIGRSKDYIRDFLEGRKTSIPLQALIRIEQSLNLQPGSLIAEEMPGTSAETLIRVATDIAKKEDKDLAQPNWPRYELRQDRLPIFSFRDAMDGTLLVDRHVQYTISKPDIVQNSPDAYGLIVEGCIMSPAYDPGDIAIINPHISFRSNADAIFFNQPTGEVVSTCEIQRSAIRRLVGYDTEHWHVQELHPARTTTLLRSQWPELYRIVGKFSRP